MRKTLSGKILFLACLVGLGVTGNIWAQTEPSLPKKNFGYSQNPKAKPAPENPERTTTIESPTTANVEREVPSIENTVPVKENILPVNESILPVSESKIPADGNKTPVAENKVPADENKVPADENKIPVKENEVPLNEPNTAGNSSNLPQTENPPTEKKEFESRSAANKTLEIVKRANTNAILPTEIYKVGVGDVLYISLQNAPTKDSTYFTVLNDGAIDYPLAGEMVTVSNLTTDEIEDLLKSKIKLFENPQISVKVREHASHSITVLGLVEKSGEKFLPREAVPLYMIRAEAIVQSKANAATIKRANLQTEQLNLKDPKSDDVLIFPGDIIEFKSIGEVVPDSAAPQFYYIGGNINAAGQKDFHSGITLTQAILASGGLRKSNARKVVIRRRNQDGLLSPLEFNLSSINDGKQPDPTLQAGDTIEVAN